MFAPKDLIQAENLLRALKQGKWEELSGEEILAFGQMMTWAATLTLQIREDIEKQQATALNTKPPKKRR